MKTICYKGKEDIPSVAKYIKEGQVVGMPTETVYGLAANALDQEAVQKIFEAKNRPMDNPLIVHICDLDQLLELTAQVPFTAIQLAHAFWPGPLTLVFERSDLVPNGVTAGGNTVAVRMPSHPLALELIKECGVPLAAPSANRSGSPSPTTARHVLNDMNGIIPAVLDGGQCSVGVESTVLDLSHGVPRLLRPGGITPEQIESVIGAIEIDPSITENVHLEQVSSPGMKYKHYAPLAKVTLLHGTSAAFCEFVNGAKEEGVAALCFEEDAVHLTVPVLSLGREDSPKDWMYHLFEQLRTADQKGYTQVYAHCPPKEGEGLAVYNRLIRAAAFDEREL